MVTSLDKKILNSTIIWILITFILWIIWVITWYINIDLWKESIKIAEKSQKTAKEIWNKIINYKLETDTKSLLFLDWEDKQIKLKLTNLWKEKIIFNKNNFSSPIYSYIQINWIKNYNFKDFINYDSDNLTEGWYLNLILNIKSSDLENKKEWELKISLNCEYINENLWCNPEWNNITLKYSTFNDLNILWIDATIREDKSWNWDKVDLLNIIDYLKGKSVNIKTMYSKEFYRNNTKTPWKNWNIILFYNSKYSSEKPITKHIENLLNKYYWSYIKWIDKYEYNESNFKKLLKPLSDCNLDEKDKTKKCWENDLIFENLTSENRYSELFYDYNDKQNIDFVFMIPAKYY